MKVTGKPVAAGVGVSFICLALIGAILILLGAKESQSPLLYICIFGGLFVAIPAVLGIAVVHEHLHSRNRGQTTGRR
jgi:hypothetical protein